MVMQEVTIYTDGGCDPNPGKGGWGAAIQFEAGEEYQLFAGGEEDTTNNRMELRAAIVALLETFDAVNEPSKVKVVIHSDSTYVVDGITKWISGWKMRNWLTKKKEPVKNADLWKTLDGLNRSFKNIQWEWIKGHSGNPGNDLADALARHGREVQKRTQPKYEEIEHLIGVVTEVGYKTKKEIVAETIADRYEMGGAW